MLGQLKDHGLIVASYIADVVTDPETTDKALGFRLDALIKLMSQLRQYKERGFLEELLCAIAEKKRETHSCGNDEERDGTDPFSASAAF